MGNQPKTLVPTYATPERRFSLTKKKILLNLPYVLEKSGKLILSLTVITIHFIVLVITQLLVFLGVIETTNVDQETKSDHKGRHRLSNIPILAIYSKRPNGKHFIKIDEYYSAQVTYREDNFSTSGERFKHNPFRLVYVHQEGAVGDCNRQEE